MLGAFGGCNGESHGAGAIDRDSRVRAWRKMLERLSVGPATVSELAAPFDMELPSFVQHLSVLEQSRLVKSKKREQVRTYEISPERLAVAEDWLSDRRQLWEAWLDRFDRYVTQLKEKESK